MMEFPQTSAKGINMRHAKVKQNFLELISASRQNIGF
jgi:hypothetical protein